MSSLDAAGRGSSLSFTRAAAVLLLAALASLALSGFITTGKAQEETPAVAPELGVIWSYRPADAEGLSVRADAIFTAEVVGVRDGTPLEVAPATEEQPPFVVPTQRIDVRVSDIFAGEPPAELTMFKLGDGELFAEGDPPYEVGRSYLLFAEQRVADDGSGLHVDGTWLPVAPDGRLLETSAGEVKPLLEGPAGDELGGLTADDAAAAAGEAGQ